MCGRCDRLENELFAYLKPVRRCLACGFEYTLTDRVCSQCGTLLPLPPGEPSLEKSGRKKMSSDIIINQPISIMKDAFSVKGLNVVVTGGNRGIGRGITQAFAESGANVAILCRDTVSGKEALAEIADFGGKNLCVACDVADLASVMKARDEVYQSFNTVNVLINNAGVGANGSFFEDEGLKEWHRVLGINLHGVAHAVQAFGNKMCEARLGGSIINISSIGGQAVGDARSKPMAPYNASKAGLDHFTHHLSVVLGDFGIRANCIAPGPTHSDLDKDLPESIFKSITEGMPMHRFGEPLEIGALAVFLASPAACQITGTVIVHDGGILVTGM
jgi:NAD(P)-dependent dehydrogenase (short-subunit alcohol dehydrogenase family)